MIISFFLQNLLHFTKFSCPCLCTSAFLKEDILILDSGAENVSVSFKLEF